MLLGLHAFCNTDMTHNSAQVLNGNVPAQESDYTAYEQIEEIPSAVVIASDCTSQTYDEDSAVVIASDCTSQTHDEDQLLNESVAVENVSVNLE